MIVTIVTLVVLSLVVLLIAGVRGIYSLLSSKSMSPIITNNNRSTVLDIFVYLGIGIALVVSITNIIQIIFTAIDKMFFDPFFYGRVVDATYSDARFAIASFVVMFPIYLALSWYTSRNISTYLYKRDIWIRKTLIYATLFISFLTLIGTLVSIVYTYLGGEMSLRFGVKALTVAGIALSLFGYYMYELRRDYSKKTFVPYVCSAVVILFSIGMIVWSITIIGTPAEMRKKKIDSTRLSDLSRLQQEILNYFGRNAQLPLSLGNLNNAFQDYAVPTDPETKEEYVYRVIDQPTFILNYTTRKKEMTSNAVFELCATFSTVREFNERGQMIEKVGTDVMGVGGGVESVSVYSPMNYYYEGDQSPYWNHETGKTCFKRVITKEMYYPQ